MSQYIEEVYEPDECYIRIKLDRNRIKLLKVGSEGWDQQVGGASGWEGLVSGRDNEWVGLVSE